jgi:hypothetical protein
MSGSKNAHFLGITNRIRHDSSENIKEYQIRLLKKCGIKSYFILYEFERRPSHTSSPETTTQRGICKSPSMGIPAEAVRDEKEIIRAFP